MRRLIPILVAMFPLATGAAAKVPLVPTTGARAADESHRLDEAETREILLFGLSGQRADAIDLHSPAVHLAGAAGIPTHDQVDEPRLVTLKDGRSSFGLCLYALIGLGLCHSGQRMRWSRLAALPDWYHSGGPQQIGASYAIGPDVRCAQTVCFVQPDLAADRWSLHRDRGDVPSRSCLSQFIRAVLACRAPPHLS